MNFNFDNIDELKKEAIAFRKGYPVRYYSAVGELSQWSPSKEFLNKWQHCYSTNNGTLAYVDGDTVYVMPFMANVEDLVKYGDNHPEKFNTMSSDNNFFVPLSNGETLEDVDLQNHWLFLRAVQRELKQR